MIVGRCRGGWERPRGADGRGDGGAVGHGHHAPGPRGPGLDALMENAFVYAITILTCLFRDYYNKMEEKLKPELLVVIFKFKEEGPLSAEGFYDVNRSILVSLIGTFLTYIIILVQMQV